MRKTKLYNNGYSGKYYLPCDNNIDFKSASLDIITPKEINKEDMVVGDLYIIENGSTVLYLEDNTFSSYDRTPLRTGINISDLNEKCLRMFWTLVRNCKNGTSDGV